MPYCPNNQCGEFVGSANFCPKCGRQMPDEGARNIKLQPGKFAGAPVPGASTGGTTFTSSRKTTKTTSFVERKPDKKGPTEGVAVNKKSAGGAVKTWMPESKAAREKLSDKMADKVLGGLADLDLPGKKKKKPAWKK
mmetsp:Transcript_1145/g.1596  ORF Transcript_1145/g.1596 Transcript_1145/m.1596 type:complete len:137 (-) Transcript_1145:202-612(-)